MKRAATAVVIVLVAFFALVVSTFLGMNGNGYTVTKEKKVTELTFTNSWGGYDSKASYLDSLLKSFNNNNDDIKVSNKSISGDDFSPYIKEKFSTGDEPDVFGLWPGSDIRTLIAAGKVADLTDILNGDTKWKSSFQSEDLDLVKSNDKIYGIPVEMTFESLFINKDLFNKYNAPIPSDYESLKQDILIFNQNGIVPIAYNSTPEGSYLYQNIAMSIGGKKVEKPFKDETVDSCYIDAMYIMRDLYNLGAFPEKSKLISMDSNERDNLFLEKKAAMITQGSWFTAKCKNKDVEMIRFPKINENSTDNMIYGLGCGTFYMSSKAYNDPKKREASIKLLKYLSSYNSCAMLAKGTDMVSCVNLDGIEIDYDKLTQRGIDNIKSAEVLVGPPDSYVRRSVWEDVIVKEFPKVLDGSLSPEEIWQKAIQSGIMEDKS